MEETTMKNYFVKPWNFLPQQYNFLTLIDLKKKEASQMLH